MFEGEVDTLGCLPSVNCKRFLFLKINRRDLVSVSSAMAQSRTQRTNGRLIDGAQQDELDTETDAE